MSKQTPNAPRYTAQERAVMRKITGAPKAVRRRICRELRSLIEQAPEVRDARREMAKSLAAPAQTGRARTKDARK